MPTINANYSKLTAGYLFPEIASRTKKFAKENPNIEIYRLGIGDTTEPLVPAVTNAMSKRVLELGNRDSYKGYGVTEGELSLRQAICNYYESLSVSINPDEVFVSDGAKSDSANIQSIFGTDNIVAVQDPAYPVYVDSNVIGGRSGEIQTNGQYAGLVYLSCNAENNFIPTPPNKKVDLIYLCFPNNPTGAVANYEQLNLFVHYALENDAIIVFDAAYSWFINDKNLPKSIFEIPNADQCCIELQSFSKFAGFTGVRLGWVVVSKALKSSKEETGDINKVWTRRQNTMFNGASNVAQACGLAALSAEGLQQNQEIIDYYMENARLIVQTMNEINIETFWKGNAPYIWAKTLADMSSWDFFDKMLNEASVVITPGSGFGPGGESYFRISSFGHREQIIKALSSIKLNLKLN